MRVSRFLNKLNWKVYILELFIVIFGISIAYQLNIINENRVSHKLEITAIQNLKKEIEINVAEFESLRSYRIQITANTLALLNLLKSENKVSLDSANKYIFRLVRTSTPDLQQEAANFYLNSNYSDSNIELKNELLSLKTYFQELLQLSLSARDAKMDGFFGYLQDAVDFTKPRVVDLDKINGLKFKNIIWNQSSDEQEINRLFKQADEKLLEVQNYVNRLLNQ